MKLNFVADYKIGGKRFAAAHSIDSSNNLTKLNVMLCLSFPKKGGGLRYFSPTSILAVRSHRLAREVAHDWNEIANKQGVLWRGEAV